MKNSKRGVTPVIATIILIAGTLVLALVVGAYTFGLFGSNVKTIQLTSGLLNSGAISASCAGANFQFTFNDPGGATYISGLTLTSGGASVPESTLYYENPPTPTCSALTLTGSTANGNALTAGGTASLDIYFDTNPIN